MRPFVVSLYILPLLAASFPYREAVSGYAYQFPRDHFEHQDFRTEWWYYTGNVTAAGGERFGFELVFFRQGERHPSQTGSAWSVQDLYLAHAALTDARGKKFLYKERLNRPGPGVAGASFEQKRIWNGNWSVKWQGENQTVEAVTDKFRFHLELVPQKPFVIEGVNGISQKAEGAGRASYYVSFPLLRATGDVDGQPVNGTAWMDHEWFTEQLAPDQQGWDWFSIQLDNNTELMLFELRKKDGSVDAWSSGTYVDAQGKAMHLKREDFTLQTVSLWHKYPVVWKICVPSLGIDLTSHAVLDDQELRSKQSGPSYWEGAVNYSGSQHGVGYVEMTGYEGQVKF